MFYVGLSRFLSCSILSIICNTSLSSSLIIVYLYGSLGGDARIICKILTENIPSLNLTEQLGWMSIEMRKAYFIAVIMTIN